MEHLLYPLNANPFRDQKKKKIMKKKEKMEKKVKKTRRILRRTYTSI